MSALSWVGSNFFPLLLFKIHITDFALYFVSALLLHYPPPPNACLSNNKWLCHHVMKYISSLRMLPVQSCRFLVFVQSYLCHREIPSYEILDSNTVITKVSIGPVPRASLSKITAFWVITSIIFIAAFRRFGGRFCICAQGKLHPEYGGSRSLWKMGNKLRKYKVPTQRTAVFNFWHRVNLKSHLLHYRTTYCWVIDGEFSHFLDQLNSNQLYKNVPYHPNVLPARLAVVRATYAPHCGNSSQVVRRVGLIAFSRCYFILRLQFSFTYISRKMAAILCKVLTLYYQMHSLLCVG